MNTETVTLTNSELNIASCTKKVLCASLGRGELLSIHHRSSCSSCSFGSRILAFIMFSFTVHKERYRKGKRL